MPSEAWQDVAPDQRQAVYVPQFFVPSTLKFAVMAVFSLGVYPVYWFYRNWIALKARTNADLSPTWRAIFAPFWAYDFFRRSEDAGMANGLDGDLPVWPLALSFALMQLAQLVSAWGLILYLLSFLPLLPVNRYLGAINSSLNPNFRPDGRFSFWNWATMLAVAAICGFVVWVLSFVQEQLNQQGSALDLLMQPNPNLF